MEIDMTQVAKVHCYPKQVIENGRTTGYILADREGCAVAPQVFPCEASARKWARENGKECEWDGHAALDEDVHRHLVEHPFREDYGCVFVGGELDGRRMTVAELREKGLQAGVHADNSEQRRRGVLCGGTLFDNAPTVAGYVGPMYGGTETPLRYESLEAYRQLSA